MNERKKRMDNNYFTIKPDAAADNAAMQPAADAQSAAVRTAPVYAADNYFTVNPNGEAAEQPASTPIVVDSNYFTLPPEAAAAAAAEDAAAKAAAKEPVKPMTEAAISAKFADLEPVSPYALTPNSEVKARRKETTKAFRRDALWTGFMMVVFTLTMDFLSSTVQILGMAAAIPQKALEIIRSSGISGLSDFYYNVFCAEGSEYFALSGITDNICYCVLVMLYCLPFIFFAKHKKVLRSTLQRGKKTSAAFIFSACITGMGLLYIWAYTYTILSEIITSLDLGYIFELFETSSNAAFMTVPGTIFYVLATCVFAPIGEEFVCRGALLGSLKKYGNWWAIIITAALFGLMHMNFYQGPYAFLMGLVLGFVAVKTESIWCSVIIHAINNTYSTACELLGEFTPNLWNALSGAVGVINLFLMPAAIVLISLGFSERKGKVISLPDNRLTQHPGDRVRAKTLRFCLSPINFLFIAFCLYCSIMLIIPAA